MNSLIENVEAVNRQRLLATSGMRRLVRIAESLKAASEESQRLLADHWEQAECPSCLFCKWADGLDNHIIFDLGAFVNAVVFQSDILRDLLVSILPHGANGNTDDEPQPVFVMATAR